MKYKQTGFTLVEILVTVTIIILLVATVITVSTHIQTQKNIALTRQCIQLLSMATAEFYDIKGHYPISSWPSGDNWDATDLDGNEIYTGCIIRGATRSGGDAPHASELLYLQLSLLPQSHNLIINISKSIIAYPPAASATVHLIYSEYPTSYLRPLKDPWDSAFNYQVSLGCARIWSNGPDKISGTEDDITN